MSAETNPEKKTKSVLIRAMRSTTGRESTTFGFSILVTVTFGVQQHFLGQPTLLEMFLYATGAVLSFTLLEGFLSRGFRRAMPQHRTETLALGTSMNLLSVLFGLGAAVLVTGWIGSTAAWIVVPFIASVAYLVLESIETALAEKILLSAGDTTADDVSP